MPASDEFGNVFAALLADTADVLREVSDSLTPK